MAVSRQPSSRATAPRAATPDDAASLPDKGPEHVPAASKQQQQQQQPPEFPPGTPLVLEVGHMGAPAYWAWVNRPAPGQPRFFSSNAAEAVTKVEWWVVPALWLPVYAALSVLALTRLALVAPQLAALQLAGMVLWQALEYSIHRWLFHAHLTSYWGITFHFLFHGCHHKFPGDGQRLVFPPLPAAAIAAAIFGGLRLAASLPHAVGLMCGVLLGYVFYDCLHYAIHHRWRLPGPLLRALRLRHLHHHFHDHDSGYGISSMLFDVLLHTKAHLLGRSS